MIAELHPKVLLVEENAPQRMMLKLSLELESLQVITAGDGAEGIHLAYSEKPRLIIANTTMAELTGYQLCHLLKNDPSTRHIPIILIADTGEKKDEFWSAEAGADAYIRRSDRHNELLKCIRNLLNKNTGTKAAGETARRQIVAIPDVTTRIMHILDTLLFESTIANRIRDMIQYIHQPEALLERFFLLLKQLVSFTLAGILIERREKGSLYVHAASAVTQSQLDMVKQHLLAQKQYQGKVVEHITIQTRQDGTGSESQGCRLVETFRIGKDANGVLLLYDADSSQYSDDTVHVVKTIARELAMLLQYVIQLEEKDAIKADFMAMIVHDLRSPLTGVIGLLKLIGEQRIGPINDKQNDIIQQLVDTIDKLLRMVNEFLDLSKLETGRLEIHPVPIQFKHVIESAINVVRPIADNNDVQIENQYIDNAQVIGDAMRLEQVLTNLLSNAIKFSRPGEKIIIGGAVEQPASGESWLKIWVQDNGVGIPADDLPYIFEKYRQAENVRTYRKKGTGLGLVICKMVIQAHGGKIWARSIKNQGTTFYFTLPLSLTR